MYLRHGECRNIQMTLFHFDLILWWIHRLSSLFLLCISSKCRPLLHIRRKLCLFYGRPSIEKICSEKRLLNFCSLLSLTRVQFVLRNLLRFISVFWLLLSLSPQIVHTWRDQKTKQSTTTNNLLLFLTPSHQNQRKRKKKWPRNSQNWRRRRLV